MDNDQQIKETVKKHYGDIARAGGSCCAPSPSGAASTSCCSPAADSSIIDLSHGYDLKELAALPEGANLGLGCGNPLTLIDIQKGWRILDLGSGAGIDVFMAARRAGETGHVTGLDMTDEMLDRARANAETGGFKNVSFVKGEIEAMPFEDNTFDLVISNCVINLVPDKTQAYREIRRVLKPGGRFAIADMATRGDMPPEVRKSAVAWAGCVAGALDLEDYLKTIREVGFSDVATLFVNEYDFARSEEFALLSVGLVGTKI